MYVKFSCGCLGISGMTSKGHTYPPVRLVDCRSDRGDIGGEEYMACFVESLREKRPYEPLSPEDLAPVLARMSALMTDGVRFAEIKRLLS